MSLLPRSWRARARLHALRFVSVLVALLLPLQGISGAIATIQAPAHYHLRLAPRVVVPAALRHALASMQASTQSTPDLHAPVAPRVSSAWLSHAAPATPAQSVAIKAMLQALLSDADAHPHSHHAALPAPQDSALADDHHKSRSVPPLSANAITAHASLDHHAADNIPGRTGSLIGHHAHAFTDAGVVYVDGNPDEPDRGASGKHASTTDATLIGWWMPLRIAMGMQSLPVADWRFRSHQDAPALRPPSAHDALTA